MAEPESNDQGFDLAEEVATIVVFLLLGLALLPFSRTVAMLACLGGLVAYASKLVIRSVGPRESEV